MIKILGAMFSAAFARAVPNRSELSRCEERQPFSLHLVHRQILEVNDLAHSRKNLLTHRKLNAGPEFAITLSPAPELDGSWTVFGEVLEGEELVNEIAGLPFVTGFDVLLASNTKILLKFLPDL